MTDITGQNEIKFETRPNEELVFRLNIDIGSNLNSSNNADGKFTFDFAKNEITYIPKKDFTGIDTFTFSYQKDNQPKTTIVSIHVANTFRPRARLIKIIGQELIS